MLKETGEGFPHATTICRISFSTGMTIFAWEVPWGRVCTLNNVNGSWFPPAV